MPDYNPSREEELDFFEVRSHDGETVRQYRLNQNISEMPRGAIEELNLFLMFKRRDVLEATQEMVLRIHAGNNVFDYAFNVSINYSGALASDDNKKAGPSGKKFPGKRAGHQK